MALKDIVEEGELDSLGDLKTHYAKGPDGKFRPIAEDGSILVHGRVVGALEKERAERRKLEAKLLGFAEIQDPIAAIEALKQVEQMKTWTPAEKVEEVAKSRVAQVVAAHQAEIAKLQAEDKKLRDLLHEGVVENAALSAMANLKLSGESAKALHPHIMRGLRMVEANGKMVARVFDTSGTEQLSKVNNDGSSMSVEEYVSSFRGVFPSLFPGTGSSGAGINKSGHDGGGLPGGVRRIKNSDLAGKRQYMAEIASGRAIVDSD